MRRRILLENNDNTIDGHAYVDLGLPYGTLWATMNVGATSETDYGDYYMYGKGSKTYDKSDYIYSGIENPLAASADTASQEWGGSWHMPTYSQFYELIYNTTYSWTSINGVRGGKFTSKTDASKYIFLPAAGYRDLGNHADVGSYGHYWGSNPDGSRNAYSLDFGSGNKGVYSDNIRRFGFSVRPVVG